MRELPRGPARRCDAINLSGVRSALTAVDHDLAVGAELHIVERHVIAGNGAGRAATRRNHMDSLTSAVFGGEEQARGIGRPRITLHPTVQRIGTRAGRSSLT